MARLSQIFLCYLQFHHVRGFLNLVEHRAIRLAWLEVERSVLGLKDNIRAELAVEWFELRHRLLHSVFAFVVGTIYKAAPHHNTAIRLQGVC